MSEVIDINIDLNHLIGKTVLPHSSKALKEDWVANFHMQKNEKIIEYNNIVYFSN